MMFLESALRGLTLWKALSTILYNQIQFNKSLQKIECNTALKARTNHMFCAGFFSANNFSNFFGFNLANHTCNSLYGAERGTNTFHVITERR